MKRGKSTKTFSTCHSKINDENFGALSKVEVKYTKLRTYITLRNLSFEAFKTDSSK